MEDCELSLKTEGVRSQGKTWLVRQAIGGVLYSIYKIDERLFPYKKGRVRRDCRQITPQRAGVSPSFYIKLLHCTHCYTRGTDFSVSITFDHRSNHRSRQLWYFLPQLYWASCSSLGSSLQVIQIVEFF